MVNSIKGVSTMPPVSKNDRKIYNINIWYTSLIPYPWRILQIYNKIIVIVFQYRLWLFII